MNKTLIFAVATLCMASCTGRQQHEATQQHAETPLSKVSFDADSAYAYAEKQVSFGPRVPGSKSHAECLAYVTGKMKQFGAKVSVQEGEGLAYNGSREPIRNIIAQYDTDRIARVLLCAHWDCRPFADHDPDPAKRDTPIDGANDGASGVAVLMEVARQLSLNPAKVGVDIIFFDCEDGGTPDHKKTEYRPDTWCVGSQYWAKSDDGQDAEHRFGILLDMVGAPNATFPIEQYSKMKAPEIIEKVWRMAERRGHGNFFSREDGGYITDDHYYINRDTHVPVVDIIHYEPGTDLGFCRTWHTQDDKIENLSRQTMAAVGETVLGVVYAEK